MRFAIFVPDFLYKHMQAQILSFFPLTASIISISS